jgi:hypothetical protein
MGHPHVGRLPTVNPSQPLWLSKSWLGADDGAPTAYTRPLGRVPKGGMRGTSFYLTSDTTIAADAANFTDFQIQTVGGTAIATWSGETGVDGAITADTPVAMNNVAAELDVAEGTMLELKVTPATSSCANLSAVWLTVDVYHQPNV